MSIAYGITKDKKGNEIEEKGNKKCDFQRIFFHMYVFLTEKYISFEPPFQNRGVTHFYSWT